VNRPDVILIGLAIAWAVCYRISLYLHPFTKCKTCGGSGRRRGTFYSYASRACATCGGSSRVLRLGVRLFTNSSSMDQRR
jgi:hypothetical protein